MILKRHVNTWDSDRTADPDLIAYPTSTTLPAEAPGKIIAKPDIRLHLTYTA